MDLLISGELLDSNNLPDVLSDEPVGIIPNSIGAFVLHFDKHSAAVDAIIDHLGDPALSFVEDGIDLWYNSAESYESQTIYYRGKEAGELEASSPVIAWNLLEDNKLIDRFRTAKALQGFEEHLKNKLSQEPKVSADELFNKKFGKQQQARPESKATLQGLNDLMTTRGVELSYCEISEEIQFFFNRPFHIGLPFKPAWSALNKVETSAFWAEVGEQLGSYSRQQREDYLPHIALNNRRNPVLEYIDSCKLDSNAPYQSFAELGTAWGLPIDEYTEFGMSLPFLSCLLRQMEPGALLRVCLLIIGKAGVGKSTYPAYMLPDELRRKYFSDSVFLDASAKARLEATRKRVILELPEWQGSRAADFEKVKAWLTSTQSSVRTAYAKGDETYVMRYAVVATANPDTFELPSNAALRARLFPIEPTQRFKDVDELELHDHMLHYRDHYWALAKQMLDSNNPCEVPATLVRSQDEILRKYNKADDVYTEAVEAIYTLQAKFWKHRGVSSETELNRQLEWKTGREWALLSGVMPLDDRHLLKSDRRYWPKFLASEGFRERAGRGGVKKYSPDPNRLARAIESIS